jgi:hypothetical protein
MLNNKTRHDTQITFYEAMVVPVLTYKLEIWTMKKQETKIDIAYIKFLKSVARYANTIIREQLNTYFWSK